MDGYFISINESLVNSVVQPSSITYSLIILSITGRRWLKFPIIIVFVYLSFQFSFCFLYFKSLLLDAHTTVIMFSWWIDLFIIKKCASLSIVMCLLWKSTLSSSRYSHSSFLLYIFYIVNILYIYTVYIFTI